MSVMSHNETLLRNRLFCLTISSIVPQVIICPIQNNYHITDIRKVSLGTDLRHYDNINIGQLSTWGKFQVGAQQLWYIPEFFQMYSEGFLQFTTFSQIYSKNEFFPYINV